MSEQFMKMLHLLVESSYIVIDNASCSFIWDKIPSTNTRKNEIIE